MPREASRFSLGNPRRDTAQEAASWVIKQDRGLTREEAAELEELLSTRPDLKQAISRSRESWVRLDSIPADEVAKLLAEKDQRPLWMRPLWREGLAAAAILLISSILFWSVNLSGWLEDTPAATVEERHTPSTRLLPDGSIVRLNRDTRLEDQFSENLRKVILKEGEAHFTIKQDPERPFVVEVDQVRVKAVGTAFNVQNTRNQIDVIVTQGTVQILQEPPVSAANEHTSEEGSPESAYRTTRENPPQLVNSGQRARIRMQTHNSHPRMDIDIFGTSINEVEAVLAWQRPLLTLGGDTLGNIARDFEQKTGMKLVISDHRLNDLRIGGRFPSDDPRGFLKILEANYGIDWRESREGNLIIGSAR